MIGAGEAAGARGALERLHPGVFPEVASQLVGAGEAPLASLPGALVRFLSCVGPQMGFQMRRLGVYFLASWNITVVNPPSVQIRIIPSVVLSGSRLGQHRGQRAGRQA